jgi:WD40 repeat protein
MEPICLQPVKIIQPSLWDIETGQVVKKFEHNETIWGSAFQPGGDLIAMVGYDGRIILWNPFWMK